MIEIGGRSQLCRCTTVSPGVTITELLGGQIKRDQFLRKKS